MNKKIFNYWYSLLKHFFKLVKSTYQINNIIFDEKNIKLICTLPRSGTHILNGVLDSYLEQLHNRGNGVPKLIEPNSFIYNIPEHFTFNHQDFNKTNNFINRDFKNLTTKFFNYVHYPIQKIPLIDFNNTRPIILVRNPIKSISSSVLLYLNHRFGSKKDNWDDDLIKMAIKLKLDETIIFFNYWEKFIQRRKNNLKSYVLIKYEDLSKDLEKYMIEILSFYQIKINKDFLLKAIEVNDKNNLKKILKKYDEQSSFLQFSDLKQLELKNKIEKKVQYSLENKKFNLFGYKF
jgi:hypothetical protein